MRIRRLKDKLGTRGVATAELDLTDTWAVEVAPPPEGFKLMMKALEISRIHNAMACAGLQRRAFLETIGYAAHRQAFGSVISAYPMVRDEILDTMVELEADCALAFAAAAAFDTAQADPSQRPWLRLVTALAKYRTAENANESCRRAIEVIGGNAYTSDLATPRLLRDAQVTTVWEGTANIQALEVLRLLAGRPPGFGFLAARVAAALEAAPGALAALRDPLRAALGECREAVELVRADGRLAQRHARRLMRLLADTLAVALVVEEASQGHARGDERKALVAERLLSRHFSPPPRRGIVATADRAQAHFDALVGYRQIAPRPLERGLRAAG